MACGTPVVLPHCGVFDELWIGRIPDGCTMRTHFDSCPVDLRSTLLSSTIVPWYRVQAFQDVSLRLIFQELDGAALDRGSCFPAPRCGWGCGA